MSTRPRIALLTDSDAFAGTEAHIFTLAQALRETGIEALICCPRHSPLAHKAGTAGIEVRAIAKRGLIDREAVNTLARLLRSEDVRILHTHNGRTHLNAVLAMRRAGTGACVATQHFIVPDNSMRRGVKAQIYGLVHRWANAQTAHFIAISEAVRQGMLDRGEAPPARVALVQNGMDAPDPAGLLPPARMRKELGIPLEAPLIVCTARLELEKDVASLVTAMKVIAAADPAARCVVAGDGSQRERLENQIRDLRVGSAVKLLGFRSDALALILAADILALPSQAEPFGLAILEAMALRRPVVATRAGGPREIVADGETGILIPPADPSALASALIRLLNCREEAARMGMAGYKRFQERYQARHMAVGTRQVYETVAAHGK